MKIRFLAALASAACLLSGCATSYQWGTSLPEDVRAVYVPTVLNESNQPDAARFLTRELQKEIRRNGVLRMVPEDEATTRLDVVISDYEQEAASYSSASGRDPNRYRMILTARVSFTRINRGNAPAQAPLWQSSAVRADKVFSGGSRTVTFKQQCLPEVAEELARHIVDGCTGAW